MITFSNPNDQNHYNLRNPIKKTKNMPKPIIANYALILLKVAQDIKIDNPKGYSKKELVSDALGHIDKKFVEWDWTQGAFSHEFAAFSYNGLLIYEKATRLWYGHSPIMEYVNYHFGPYTEVPLKSTYCYDEAVVYNMSAQYEWNKKKYKYKKIKEIGNQFFFQD